MFFKLKQKYWQIESILFEKIIRFLPMKVSKRSHSLPSPLIVSLTSFPPRFEKLKLTIKGLLRQETKADKIILWIANNDLNLLPKEIKQMSERYDIFEINTYQDIGSYKKLIPTLKMYPSSYIVTADDDVYYPKIWLGRLIENISSAPAIIAHRTHELTFDKAKNINSYNDWNNCYETRTSAHLMGTGIGGIVYPPNTFSLEVLNEDAFLSLCKNADDIWFFWMSRLNGIPTKWSGYSFNVVTWLGTNETGLAKSNVSEGKNDICIQNLIAKYGEVW
jgi:hypothetical protein